MSTSLYEYQSRLWDMDISLSDLLDANDKCKVDREYKRHKYDDCYNGYCMYLKHPNANDYTIMIGIYDDGFMYIGDGGNKDLELENTVDVVKEMFFYGEWVKCKNDCLNKKSS